MTTASIDGIETRYEVFGSGPPILMYAPGGFDATIEKWRALNVYARIKLLDHLPSRYTCIAFDRRECGQSGGRIEPVTWAHFVEQGKGLLDHLGHSHAHILGGCMGVSCAIAFAAKYPDRVSSLLLWWPVGVEKYKAIVTDMAIALLDRDTAPGAEPEDMLQMDIPALIIPGRDESHATSAARYLEECLPKSQYWDVAVDGQTEDASNKRILEFLEAA